VYVTNLEKSNLIANAFSNVNQSHDFNVSTTESETIETSIDIIRNSVIELTPNVLVSPTEVRNTIRSLRLAKVAGPDQINSRLLIYDSYYERLFLNTHTFQLPGSRQMLFQF
jgi:hypothetical protein